MPAKVLKHYLWQFDVLMDNHRAPTNAFQSHPPSSSSSSLDIVKSVYAAERKSQMLRSLPDNSDVWGPFEGNVADMLVDLWDNPFRFDADKWVARGVLQVVTEAPPRSDLVAQYYIREVRVSREALLQYLLHFPADLPRGLFWSLQAGYSKSDLQKFLEPCMSLYNLDETICLALDHFADAHLSNIRFLKHCTGELLTMLYIGYGIGNTPWERFLHDLGYEGSRVTNSTALTGHFQRIFHICRLNMAAVSSTVSVHTDPAVWITEHIPMMMAGGASLNSSQQGIVPDFEPTTDLLNAIAATFFDYPSTLKAL